MQIGQKVTLNKDIEDLDLNYIFVKGTVGNICNIVPISEEEKLVIFQPDVFAKNKDGTDAIKLYAININSIDA